MEIIAPAKGLVLRYFYDAKWGSVSKEIKEVIINLSSILFINIGIIDFPCKPILERLLPFNT